MQTSEPTTAQELVETFRWVDEVHSQLEALRLAVVNELAYWPTTPGNHDQPDDQRHDAVPGVLSAELGWGKTRSASYDNLAYRLREQLTATYRALHDGLITEAVAHAISDGLVCLDLEQQLDLEANVLAWIRAELEQKNQRVNAARVRAWLEREVIKADPDAAKERHQEKSGRRDLQLLPDIDSCADLQIYNLPADQARLVYDHIDALAHEAKRAGDERRLGQLRADIAVELLSGHATRCHHQSTEGGESCGGPQGKGTFVLYVSLAELLGLRDEPGELGGYGPVIRDVAQRLVANGIDDPDAEFDLAVTNSRGQVIQLHGINKRLFTGKLRDLVNATWRRCTFPSGCNRPAETCEVDHSTDWARGGATTWENANPICGSEHHEKTENGWRQQRPDPYTGEIIWHSPFGQTYRVLPEPLVDPDPTTETSTEDATEDAA